jgi:CubicO group peptidase (beta-lactamase class C family)
MGRIVRTATPPGGDLQSRLDPALRRVTDLPVRGSPAGGGYSTCQDLLRFVAAIEGHRLLDAVHTRLITTGQPGTPRQTYGYGFATSSPGQARSYGHGGGAPGINADLKVFPDSGYVVAVMSNLDPPAATQVSGFISARLPIPRGEQ